MPLVGDYSPSNQHEEPSALADQGEAGKVSLLAVEGGGMATEHKLREVRDGLDAFLEELWRMPVARPA